MSNLPIGNFEHYAGVDPGHRGAIAVMNAKGTYVKVYPMPVVDGRLDRHGLRDCFRSISRLPSVFMGIEHPEAFPGSFGGNPRDNDIFGQQKGTLETMAFVILGPDHWGPISPVLWKGRLGLDGKTIVGSNDRAAALFDLYYPEHHQLYRGPRGGLLDGPLDALLITHFLRTRTGEGMKSIADKFGKGSVEAMAFILGGARRKRKFGKRLP